ncbi:MAG: DUF1549 domain-containing protein [Puia sp.]|nr:DUF1549 domain-containing protein [Puia sp.]
MRVATHLKIRCNAAAFLFFLATILPCLVSANGPAKTAGTGFWLWAFLGRLHPMIVHFPIGLLYAALLFELIMWRRRSPGLQASVKVLVVTGAVSSVLAVLMGLLLINTDDYGSNVLPLHQWTGIATMILAGITTWAYLKRSRRLQKSLLTLTVLGVTVAGHYGASLTHGEDYLSSVLPFGNKEEMAGSGQGEESEGLDASFKLAGQNGPLTDIQVQDLNLQVRTILAHNCYSCHGSAKTKGDLRLDSKDFILKGGKDGSVMIPGHPEKSELIRRILLPRDNKEAMPSKGKGLSEKETAVLQFWIKQGAPWPKGPLKSLFRVAALEPRLPEVPPVSGELTAPIDRFVNSYFEKNKIAWQKPVDDRTYIRRVYIDVIGLIPPADSVDAFIAGSQPDKRERLVRGLLSRSDDYAQQWLTFWNDALRNDYTGTGYITGGRSDITRWLYASLRDNKPYNLFVKQLISPDSSSMGFIRGIEWRGVVNASQRTEMQAAQNVSQVFLGLNLKCASCHDSFVSDWKLDESYAFASIFSDSALEINRCDKPTGRIAGTRILYKELGTIDSTAKRADRLQQLADYLVQPKDGRLYRTLVNRIWAQLMGRGIVEPVDVMDNAPWSQDLLDWMAFDFVASGYDIKKLLYNILTSRTYQLPSVAVEDAAAIVAPNYTFRGMVRRRMSAEEFSDAVSESLQNIYADSMIVYNLLPGSIKADIPFPRASLVKNDAFLTALGRPNRETVSTSRTSQANLLQALELTNGSLFNDAMRRAALSWKARYTDPDKMVREIYRSTLGRLPSSDETAIAEKALGKTPTVENVQDFVWSMALHPEFQLIY